MFQLSTFPSIQKKKQLFGVPGWATDKKKKRTLTFHWILVVKNSGILLKRFTSSLLPTYITNWVGFHPQQIRPLNNHHPTRNLGVNTCWAQEVITAHRMLKASRKKSRVFGGVECEVDFLPMIFPVTLLVVVFCFCWWRFLVHPKKMCIIQAQTPYENDEIVRCYVFEEIFAWGLFPGLFLPEKYPPPPLPAMGFSLQQNILDQASNIPQVLTRTSSSQKKVL